MKSIQFHYEFIPKGSTVDIECRDNQEMFVILTKDDLLASKAYWVEDTPDSEWKKAYFPSCSTIFLDVGNRLREGIIDHHHLSNQVEVKGNKLQSTADIVVKCPSFLQNIKEGTEKVTVFLHSEPDVDAFTAAYLVTYYLQQGQFPENYQYVLEYAIEIDTGRLGIDPSLQVVTPYTIALVMGSAIKQSDSTYHQYVKEKNWPKAAHHFNTQLLKRGFDLIDFLFTRLGELEDVEKTLFHPNIMKSGHPFPLEESMVLSDYEKYQEDLRTRCETKSMRLPHRTDPGEINEVDGLFWTDFPACSLHKLWARSDRNSPSGKGYAFTFIPSNHNTQTKPEEVQIFEEEIQEKIKTVTRVIISVDPVADVCLKNLAIQLERAEQKKEAELLKDKVTEWRAQSPRRFPEDWCINNDPWYDGRDFGYTIVDAPRKGSLLSLEEIHQITLDYVETKVFQPLSRIVYPFEFDQEEYDSLCQSLSANPGLTPLSFVNQKERAEYFGRYIQSYLFNLGDSPDSFSCRYQVEKIKTVPIDFYFKSKEIVETRVDSEPAPTLDEGIKRERAYIQHANIILFRYGIGFLVVDTTIEKDQIQDYLLLRSILAIHKELCEGTDGKARILHHISQFLDDSFQERKYEDGLIYTTMTIDHQTFYASEREKLVFNLCTHSLMSRPFQRESDHMKNALSKMVYSYNDHVVYGYSKKGKALIFINHEKEREGTEKSKQIVDERRYLLDRFDGVDFDIFLLVLHQRYSLMHFSRLLAKYGLQNPQVSKLRDSMYNFIVQGWFSQITHDDIGMETYKKWKQTFETETLHDEVKEQISTIDDYQNAKKTQEINHSITMVSTIVLPASLITGFFGMNVPFIKAEAPITGWSVILFAFISYLILILWLNKKGLIVEQHPVKKMWNRIRSWFGKKEGEEDLIDSPSEQVKG